MPRLLWSLCASTGRRQANKSPTGLQSARRQAGRKQGPIAAGRQAGRQAGKQGPIAANGACRQTNSSYTWLSRGLWSVSSICIRNTHRVGFARLGFCVCLCTRYVCLCIHGQPWNWVCENLALTEIFASDVPSYQALLSGYGTGSRRCISFFSLFSAGAHLHLA